jgi:hypothetical protein
VCAGLGMVSPNPTFTSMVTVFGLAGIVGTYPPHIGMIIWKSLGEVFKKKSRKVLEK